MSVVVVTDASAAIAPERVREAGIHILPLHVLSSEGEFIDHGTGYEAERFVKEGVTTSGPSVGEVREVLEAAVAEANGDGVVVITMSSHLSSTYSTAVSQAALIDDSITVIDSRCIDMAMGFGVLEAARLASTGATADEVAEAAHAVLGSAEGFFCVATLDHLRAGGRVSALAALLGGALQIVPVLRLADGRIVSERKTRTVSRARDQLAALASQHLGDRPARVAVHHVEAPDAAAKVADQVRSEFPQLVELVIGPFGGTIAAHLGPGAVGVAVAPALAD
ncbi:DegV family protein OS=Tsukamurella paurometabola (strain ATCC 8368 / DSM / CCUG 35730 / CIP 100753 / JCM 10117 / KCTC 9821 / NBRC 16120 / NCIMB 702349/ NCTC 13040) OX=521096 GN=Tpau_2804 PE=4 SV=1 [Tsukamurella paurometabola]|uniref:DegV family protein n=1 Tax=Tsukamurella paurometabola (strain ATCC 8368 / DSM 20162 / CCUG 35730 / CIP 100753 / JCM 10117 / KCTC 9821 / NBRC 16120 / NCIMB 702349 / NCTC 13040) TaxID=521096 RepID=D5UTB7_TSUPD|nr:DegV family protein [Tsukamurella paurometabola]ADG79402.1 degV family protein [Tsukamurella paurometabola DSM 20162]SUP35574.1 EDD domain protein, DegV family [Tsukamurella paurometabola]